MPSSQPESIPEKLNLDFENKLVNPSLELFESLKLSSAELYQNTREILSESHHTVAKLGQQFYDHPSETATQWYNQAAYLGSETLAAINNELIPELRTIYDTGTRNLQAIGTEWSGSINDISAEANIFFKAFYDNPPETLGLLYGQLKNGVSNLSEYSVELYNQIASAISLTYQSSIAILNLFINEPKLTAQEYYYSVVSGLLDLYTQLINSALQLLGNSVQYMV